MFNGEKRFVTGAPSLEDCPPESIPEVCLSGRSNVGKSSLINAIAGRRQLARTSNVPGKTQQMNFYNFNEAFYLIDLPGFGYAKAPKKERERWERDIKKYVLNRKTLRLVLHLVDSRHGPTPIDEDFFYWLGSNEIPFVVVLSKTDKISTNALQQILKRTEKILDELNIEVPIVPVSSEKKKGMLDIQEFIHSFTHS